MLPRDGGGVIIRMDPNKLAHGYLDAKEYILDKGYERELDWQTNRSFNDLEESEFLQEIAWVVLVSGFRESVVRRLFPAITEAFYYWQNTDEILCHLSDCRSNAFAVFANPKKIDAICSIITSVASDGFPHVKRLIKEDGLQYLITFPMIGPISGVHLLKNIGFPVAKPDRHLVRIASSAGFVSVTDLCMTIQAITGDAISEVDYVLWRYATLKHDYLVTFQI